jgi:hypothetical protein
MRLRQNFVNFLLRGNDWKKRTLSSMAGGSRSGLLYIASRTDSRLFFLQFPGARAFIGLPEAFACLDAKTPADTSRLRGVLLSFFLLFFFPSSFFFPADSFPP